MRTVREIIESHVQESPFSCNQWATEIVIMSKTDSLSSRLQKEVPFGEPEAILAIKRDAKVDFVGVDIPPSLVGLDIALADSLRHFPCSILIVPSIIYFHPLHKNVDTAYHAYVAFEDAGKISLGWHQPVNPRSAFAESSVFITNLNVWMQTIAATVPHRTPDSIRLLRISHSP